MPREYSFATVKKELYCIKEKCTQLCWRGEHLLNFAKGIFLCFCGWILYSVVLESRIQIKLCQRNIPSLLLEKCKGVIGCCILLCWREHLLNFVMGIFLYYFLNREFQINFAKGIFFCYNLNKEYKINFAKGIFICYCLNKEYKINFAKGIFLCHR